MKNQFDDGNYEGLIVRLTKGSLQQKSNCLKKLNFLYDNARSRIYLYERRITECLQILLLTQQKQISFMALTLLEKIISNSSSESQNFSIIKKRLLTNIVLNLGSIQINVRKISHKCIIEFVRKFRECDTILPAYIKTAMQQTQNYHLKLKSINSLHSLIMTQPKSFMHGSINSQIFIEQLIYSSYQKQHGQIKKAATLCLIYCLRLDGSEKTLKLICSNAQNDLYKLTFQNEEIASILELIMKFKTKSNQKDESQIQSTPSPKFMTLNEEQMKKQINQQQIQKVDRITDQQMKIYNQINYAEQFLKKLQKTQLWQIKEIKQFVPYLQKYLIDQSIKLFSISKKIVQVIFQNQCQKQRQYYIILVPCVVNGIGNKRFIVRKNLNKLVRQYLKKHTEVWVQNFIQKMSKTSNPKVKEILIQLFMHAHRTSPQFYHNPQKTFHVMEKQVKDLNSNLKWKAIDCLIMVIQRQGKTEKMRQDMMSTLSPQVYNKLLRKMNKTHNSIGSHSGSINEPLSPVQKFQKKERRFIRMITDDPNNSLQKQGEIRKDNNSEERVKPLLKEKKVRKSHAEIDFKLKKPEKKQRQEKDSIKKLPELRKIKNSNVSKIQVNESPVKKSLGQKSIMYIDKENLPEMVDPKLQLNKALLLIRDHSWNTQFQSINSLRSVIEYHKQIISEQYFATIINELLSSLNNMRSGVSKISLICLGELLKKFHKKSYPFTQSIVNTLIKKSITTSDFIQQEIKRCIMVSVQELCPNRIISSLSALKQNKSSQIKVSVILMLEIMIQNEKIYKRQTQWIWNMIIDFSDDQNQSIRNEAKKITKLILQKYSDWKNQVIKFKSITLEKIDRILRSISSSSSSNSWIQTQNRQLNKIIISRTMTTKYFEKQYGRFQELDKAYVAKKNWKQRIKLVNQVFSNSFQYTTQFQLNCHAKKYIYIACDHLDEKNPGLFLNILIILNKSIDTFPILLQQCLSNILQKTLGLIQVKKTEIGQTTQKFLNKLYNKVDNTKLSKQLFKISVGNNQKIKIEALNQLINIWKGSKNLGNNIQSISLKVLQKLSVDPVFDDKLKEIINLGIVKFGNEFQQKIQENEKLSIFLE